jgi:hypothetical protein
MKGVWQVLYEDRRLGGEPILTLGPPEDWDMRIPDIVLDCVGFFYVFGSKPGPEVADHGGTGFFVSVPSRGDVMRHMYLVTAKHVALEAPKAAADGRVWLRYTAGAAPRPIQKVEVLGKWEYHDDPSVDLAVQHFKSYPVVSKDRSVLPRPIIHSAFLSREKLDKYDVGIGDDLSVVGLFRQRPGIDEHIPIVRNGIISAMPGEPIPQDDGLPSFVAYLAEVRSIRGLSGSPVFVNLALGRHADGTYNKSGSLPLIGVIRGHFETRRPPQMGFDRHLSDDEKDLKEVNSGISMVTPISYLADILNKKVFMDGRREEEQKAAAVIGESTTLDSGFASGKGHAPDESKAERLAVDLPMDEAVKKMFGAGKPPK